MASPAPLQAPTERVPVWDRFVRVFHWSLVACVLANGFITEAGEWLHQWLGYTAVALVVARIGWGFVGSAHARFASFFPTPARLRAHGAALRQGRQTGRLPRHEGHNPLGALMMLLLMALVLLLGLTGWLQGTDRYWGVEWVATVHEWLANTLLAAAGLHAAAGLVMGRLERTNLVAAMVSGVKVYKQ